MYQPGPTFSLWLPIIILFLAIYHYEWKDASWERKRDIATVVAIIITIILLPLHFGGIYNLASIESGGQYPDVVDHFVIGPAETHTSLRLSNRYVIYPSIFGLSVYGSEVTFYICDENSPEVHHRETNFSSGEYELFFWLPYLYTEIFAPANWTLKFFNPGRNYSDVFFELSPYDYDIIIDPGPIFDDPISYYQLPTIALFSVWTLWGVITLAAHENELKRLRPKIEQSHHVENQEPEDNEAQEDYDDSPKYKKLRDRG